LLASCAAVTLPPPPPSDPPPPGPCAAFDRPDVAGTVTGHPEISGIVASQRHPGLLWIHEDSGGAPELYALDETGTVLGTLRLSGASNLDWEDLAEGPCGDTRCLFVADIGDNLAQRADLSILVVEEPDLPAARPFVIEAAPRALPFSYPDGPQDAEALVVSPAGAPVVFTKRQDGLSRAFLLDPDASAPQVAQPLADFAAPEGPGLATSITAADLSTDGLRLLLRGYFFAWELDLPGAALSSLGEVEPHSVELGLELQGEAISYTHNLDGFWHIAEGQDPPLYRARCAP
jgi:hypothetical protein